jgi:hypothetical protein
MSDGSNDEAGLRERLRARRVPAPGSCPPPETWVELYRNRLGEDAAERARDHLVECAACREAALDARRFLTAMGIEAAGAAEETTQPPDRRGLAALLAALLVVAAGVGFWWLGARRALPEARWQAAQYAPVSVDPTAPVLRDASALDPVREAAFARAMEPYAAADYPAAARALAAYLATEPDDLRAVFYRAVALGLAGERAAAAPLLERVAHDASPRLADEARWYLALAALDAGDRRRARGLFEAVAASGSPRAVEAAALADRLAE